MKKKNISIEAIDACLPQTQCQQCGYHGCLPYAEALSLGEVSIDKCPPGGLTTLLELAKLLGDDPTPYRSTVMSNTRPNQVVHIDETRCIGCTKCISACPVDAIVGATKLMHTVITDHCTGCELCIDPCPVDCIDIRIISTPASKVKAFESRQRYKQRQLRIKQRQIERQEKHAIAKKQVKQSYILAAIGRVKEKKEFYHVSSNE